MASGSGDSVTRRSVASQFFTQEEGPGIDGMTTSERVSVAAGLGVGKCDSCLCMMLSRKQITGGLQEVTWTSMTPGSSVLPGGRSPEPGCIDHQ